MPPVLWWSIPPPMQMTIVNVTTMSAKVWVAVIQAYIITQVYIVYIIVQSDALFPVIYIATYHLLKMEDNHSNLH